ncbi:unnamed protein product [Paramecium octaurelia]|uniref:AN1-type domain-containing protein n=1 Tax=Paramecium octaurelia TaxID=43137 RepID=A0A8S1UNY4_PAROT|nr:unnamed protein product [Paramecium octaurelia]
MNLDDQMERCDVEYCKRRDFLPFKCTLCNRKFCLEHKELKEHECPFQFAERKALKCNQCNQVINYLSTQFEIDALKQHVCQKINIEKSKCPQCKITLNDLNKFYCTSCKRLVCLKHRMKDEHECDKYGKFNYCKLM